jgi:hypothetical protein
MLSHASSSSWALVDRDADTTIAARASSAHRASSQRESGAADRGDGAAFFFFVFLLFGTALFRATLRPRV